MYEPTYRPFARGWIITEASDARPLPEATTSWKQAHLGDFVLRYDELVGHHQGNQNEWAVHALGILMDVTDFNKDEAAICQSLAACLPLGWDAFYRALMPLAGAFVFFISSGERRLSVVLDATGTVPACYDAAGEAPVVASHPGLVAQVNGAGRSHVAEQWRQHPMLNKGGAYMPGLLTEFEGVEIITPNQRFDVPAKTMTRFYPNSPLVARAPEDIALEVAPLLVGQMEALARRYPLAISLSGGLDTRVTLAASHAVSPQALYFTYYTKGGVLGTDREVAEQLRASLSLEHVAFPSSAPLPEHTKALMLEHDGLLRTVRTNLQIARHIGPDRLHVRSNTLEVGRGFYLKNSINHPNRFTAEKLSRLFRLATKDEFEPYFAQFIDRASFRQDKFYNFHYSDLFYWEHRLGGNYGPLYRDGRAYFETYMIYNCRLILDLLLSASLEERKNAEVIWLLIRQMWPEVLDVPVFSGSKFIEPPIHHA